MSNQDTRQFLAGVIEGFYGPPWSQRERSELFDWMAAWGLNTYLYAPKDDLKHRAIWREPYTAAETKPLEEAISACARRSIQFFHAISPGLDIRYSDDAEIDRLKVRLDQMRQAGCRHFALLFDDIPDALDASDLRRWGSLAAAQSHVANRVFEWQRAAHSEARLLFCPTPYCGRMAERQHGGPDYLATLGSHLLPDVDVLWTGPEIISREITVEHAAGIERILRRKPVIWDNLHANDYDGRRFFCGPYAGRPPALRGGVGGILANPNTEFPLNFIPLHTLAAYVRAGDDWEPRRAYLDAMQAWIDRFETIDRPMALDDLILFGDCHYLPHEDGSEARRLIGQIEQWMNAVAADPATRIPPGFRNAATRLREFCARTTELRDRPLFHALSRRVWELREELDLLERFIQFQLASDRVPGTFTSDFHLPGTYRGGWVARLQHVLVQHPNGTFTPAGSSHDAPPPDRRALTKPRPISKTTSKP